MTPSGLTRREFVEKFHPQHRDHSVAEFLKDTGEMLQFACTCGTRLAVSEAACERVGWLYDEVVKRVKHLTPLPDPVFLPK